MTPKPNESAAPAGNEPPAAQPAVFSPRAAARSERQARRRARLRVWWRIAAVTLAVAPVLAIAAVLFGGQRGDRRQAEEPRGAPQFSAPATPTPVPPAPLPKRASRRSPTPAPSTTAATPRGSRRETRQRRGVRTVVTRPPHSSYPSSSPSKIPGRDVDNGCDQWWVICR